MDISVVVPTRDRPHDVSRLVQALARQNRPPQEIVFVDQSESAETHSLLADLTGTRLQPRPIYLHDSRIPGLAAARNVGISVATADVIVFMDDDLAPEPDCLQELELAFVQNPEYAGIGGVELQMESMSALHLLYYEVFFRGPFRDRKYRISKYHRRLIGIQPVTGLKGCLAGFRNTFLAKYRFDERLTLQPLDDLDICWQARGQENFGIWPKATGWHYLTKHGRLSIGRSYEVGTAAWGFFYKKHVANYPSARAWFLWLCFGLALNAVRKSITVRSIEPVLGLIGGWHATKSGFRDVPEFDMSRMEQVQPVRTHRQPRCLICSTAGASAS